MSRKGATLPERSLARLSDVAISESLIGQPKKTAKSEMLIEPEEKGMRRENERLENRKVSPAEVE